MTMTAPSTGPLSRPCSSSPIHRLSRRIEALSPPWGWARLTTNFGQTGEHLLNGARGCGVRSLLLECGGGVCIAVGKRFLGCTNS